MNRKKIPNKRTALSAIRSAYIKLQAAYAEFDLKGYITCRPIRVGVVDKEILSHGRKIGRAIKNPSIYFKNDELEHARRDTKMLSGKCVSREDICRFPFTKSSMHIFYNPKNKRYVYTDYKNMFILDQGQPVKLSNGKTYAVILVTATKPIGKVTDIVKEYTRIK